MEQLMSINIKSDWVELLDDKLRSMNLTNYQPANDEDVILTFLREKRRTIPQMPCRIFESQQFQSEIKTLPLDIQAGYTYLNQKIRNGEDLNPHLTRKKYLAPFNDLLLNDWGIMHFHLGINPDSNDSRFIEGTELLLFAKIEGDQFFAIGIYHHKSDWARKDIIDRIASNWPDLLPPLNNFKAIGNYTDEEIAGFRKGSINTVITSQGHSYLCLGGGMAQSDDNLEDIMLMNKTLKSIVILEQDIRDHFKPILNTIQAECGNITLPIQFCLGEQTDSFFIGVEHPFIPLRIKELLLILKEIWDVSQI